MGLWGGAHTGLRVLRMRFNVKVVGCHPHRPQGGLIAAPLKNPRLFHCALPLAGYIPAAQAIAANAAATRSSHFRFGPARKNTLAVSHRSFDVVLSAAKGFLKRNLTFQNLNKLPLTLKCHWPRSKITLEGEAPFSTL